MKEKVQFASDNYAGICPEAWKGLEEANFRFAKSYGDDDWTRRAADRIRETFETDCEVFFVFNGTSANSLALSALCRSWHSVICHELAHIETDECGGPEFFSNGTKILTVGGADGKVDPEAVERTVTRRSDIHYPKPRALSITQPTELGTVYSLSELAVLKDRAEKHGLKIHMDGARFANALVSLDVPPADLTWKAGVDVLCFGGTKNGMAMGEAVVFFSKDLAEEFGYHCKQAGQLASKMRFLSGQWISMLETGAWLTHAWNANRMAKLLESRLHGIPGVEIMHPCEANSLFLRMEEPIGEALRKKGWYFYNFIGTGWSRFMCSWNTSIEDVESLTDDIREAAKATARG